MFEFRKDMKIRRLNSSSEISECLKTLGRALWDQRINSPNLLSEYAKKFAQHAVFIVAESEISPIGFAAYYRNDVQSLKSYLSMIAIDARHRGKGVGTALIAHVETDCLLSGFREIRLEVAADNQEAMLFYQNRGYICEGDSGRDSFYYSKKLGGDK